ncbi:LADA_0C05270g1_1 [Lachancea dasiensis]|uniref:LADA_0C05270g1_1 n=1 Tax=Lachancea dasiensis TaxID=1072105 RepID=A0A1G4IYX7_9SACH|nr:LADA_0C05270g1_1 [Lachancea dasiensis]
MLRSALRTAKPTSFIRSMASKTPKTYEFDDIKSLVQTPDAQKLLIDVREPSELQEYSMPTAINLPLKSAPGALGLSAEEFREVFDVPKPASEKELIFFCAAGIRAKAAEELAQSFGYENTAIYPGSIHDWLDKGGAKVKNSA